MEKGRGGFFTGGSGAELGKWSSAPTSATFSSSCSSREQYSMFPGFVGAAGPNQQLEFQPQLHPQYQQNQQQQHMTCLKLGKRQYYGEAADQEMGIKREKPGGIGVNIPRCQVEGCKKPLLDAKDYHRRHKVCEMHSKAPSVLVLGVEKRFCQQCSRFHVITEFDSTKRSCRRRLAGHNERRRKNANESVMRNPSLDSSLFGSRFAYPSPSSPGRALSLLSSKVSPWILTPELSSSSSAALRELMAENRAALLARQQLFSNQSVITYVPHQNQRPSQAPPQLLDGWNRFQDSGSHATLDLVHDPNSASFGFLARNKSKEDEEGCCEIWKSLEGTHVV